VIVLGAGLSGLTAAYELGKRGHSVTLLEAQTRPGGRVLTLRAPFDDGLYADAGATRIPDCHALTLGYARELGLTLVDVPASTRQVYHLGGHRFVHDSGAREWPRYALAASEAEHGYEKWIAELLDDRTSVLGDAWRTGWLAEIPAAARELDRVSLAQWFEEHGASRELLRLFLAEEGPDLAGASLLHNLIWTVSERGMRGLKAIAGGNDRLPHALAAKLGLWTGPGSAGAIRYGCAVTRVEQDEAGVTVELERGGARERLAGDRVVCGLPFAALRRVDLSAAHLPRDKLRAIAELGYEPLARIYHQTRTRFWEREGLGGGLRLANTDLPVQRCWDMTSLLRQQPRGIILSYIAEQDARALAARDPEERVSAVSRDLVRVFPELLGQFERGAQHLWHEDRWQGGAWARCTPGQAAWLLPIAGRIEGRIHFAGEHTSVFATWMQGGIESGQRAALEIEQTCAAVDRAA
jgi:monoamine oxidase